ncbi:carotenoid ester lipase precursor [Agrocybe pediades]|nr:carotenoid ester lipase precursor [Agrocybe pediades]
MLALSLLLAFPASTLGWSLTGPSAVVDLAVVRGVESGNVEKFLGIPFAKAPRFKLPVPVPRYYGIVDAKEYGPSCPQQSTSSSLTARSLEEVNVPRQLLRRDGSAESEDCLSLNVIKPKIARASDKLPVVVWIYGGGFEVGSALGYDDVSTRVVEKSIAAGTPVIHVAMNYRVSAFGFLASKEVKKERLGNFGLYDQRVALQWVQKYIRSFGGDPGKVTIWGQSAGAISVALQMLAFNGKTDGLFHAGFMQSGAPIPVGDITNGQADYDALVAQTGCSKSKNTLDCLRKVPFPTLQAAINASPNFLSYNSLALAWTPRVDGVFIKDEPFKMVQQGRVAKIPIVNGNMDDEATIFSASQSNITTEADFREYIKSIYVKKATDAELEPLWSLYPSTPSEGSPYDTGDDNALYPQYKRIASFQGDLVFQAPRRHFLQSISGKQKIWSYLSKNLKAVSGPYGSFHGADIQYGLFDDYLIQFVNTFNPNLPSGPNWPEYTKESPDLYTFTDTAAPSVTPDNFRAEPIDYLIQLASTQPQ